MAVEQFSNLAQTTLSAAITTTGATTCTVTSATGFPASGNFRIIIDNEIMIVTAVSGTTFTITRGAESTTAATHSNGATVTHVVTAGGLLQGIQDSNKTWCFYGTSSGAVTNNATYIFSWTATFDDGFLSSGTKLVVPTTGFYLFNAYIHWASSGVGIRIIEWRKNGACGTYMHGMSDVAANTVNDVRQQSTALLYLNANDYLELTAFQNQGSTNTPSIAVASCMQVKTTA